METTRSALLVPVLFAVLVMTAGCTLPGGGDGSGTDSIPDAETIQSDAAAAMQAVDTMRIEMTTNATVAGRNVTTEATTVIDRETRRLRSTVTSQGQELTQYVINETLYLKAGNAWQTRSVDSDLFWNETAVERQQQFLDSANVTVEGTDTVTGESVYVLTIRPSEAELRGLFENGGMGAQLPLENVEFSDVAVTQYVDTDDAYVRRTHVSVNMTFQGQETSVDTRLTFSEFDEPVTIELPEDAPTE